MKRSANTISGSQRFNIKTEKLQDGSFRAYTVQDTQLEGRASDERQARNNLSQAIYRAESEGKL